MEATSAQIETLLKSLAETPRRIASATLDLEDTCLQFKPNKNSWSVNDILAHLRACADVWGRSVMAMIAQDHPTLRYVSPRTWIRKTDYLELEFHQSLVAFTRQREELVKSLEPLAITDWSRGATFTGTTKGREQTVLSYAQRMTQHENEHYEQVEALLK